MAISTREASFSLEPDRWHVPIPKKICDVPADEWLDDDEKKFVFDNYERWYGTDGTDPSHYLGDALRNRQC